MQASGDQLANKALAVWKRNFTVDADYNKHVTGHIYEAKNIDGTRCFCKQFKPLGFPFGSREANITRDLTARWQDLMKEKKVDVTTFPLPVLLGTLRTDREITEPAFRKRWMKNFSEAEPPEEGELWCIFSWDKCSFKSLRTFAELPMPSAGFSSRSQQSLFDMKWRFLRRVVRLTLEALDFVHSSGYCHGSVSAEAIWLRTFDPSDTLGLTVKITDLGLSERLTDLSSTDRPLRIDRDHSQLGFVLLSVILSVFGTKAKGELKELRSKIAGVRPESLDQLSSTFNVEQGLMGHRELERVYESVCDSNINSFMKVLQTVACWRTPLGMLGENTDAGANLFMKLIAGKKAPVAGKWSALLDVFDKK